MPTVKSINFHCCLVEKIALKNLFALTSLEIRAYGSGGQACQQARLIL